MKGLVRTHTWRAWQPAQIRCPSQTSSEHTPEHISNISIFLLDLNDKHESQSLSCHKTADISTQQTEIVIFFSPLKDLLTKPPDHNNWF